ncbi:MAG: 16S rRNA (guanine(527)-N(7))-methyltransferase RsmG [Bacillota bacterium]
MDPQALGLLREGAASWGLKLDNREAALFSRLADCLSAGSARLNLTAITIPEEIVVKHFLDSLAGLQVIDPAVGKRIIDVGSGAGFPGLPLKIVRPELELTLLESSRKKAGFLEATVRELGLEGVLVTGMRAEEAGRDPAHRGNYHWAVARALAPVSVLGEYCLPFLQVPGVLVAYKGPAVGAELARARHALAVLGGVVREVLEFKLPGVEDRRSLVVIEKTASTPERFPRRAGAAAKRPL